MCACVCVCVCVRVTLQEYNLQHYVQQLLCTPQPGQMPELPDIYMQRSAHRCSNRMNSHNRVRRLATLRKRKQREKIKKDPMNFTINLLAMAYTINIHMFIHSLSFIRSRHRMHCTSTRGVFQHYFDRVITTCIHQHLLKPPYSNMRMSEALSALFVSVVLFWIIALHQYPFSHWSAALTRQGNLNARGGIYHL